MSTKISLKRKTTEATEDPSAKRKKSTSVALPPKLSIEVAVAAAKKWYDEKGAVVLKSEPGQYAMKEPVRAAFRNSETHYSVEYETEPGCGKRIFLRFGFEPKRKRGAWNWKVKSYSEEACAEVDDRVDNRPEQPGPSLRAAGQAGGELSQEAAVAAAVEWYDVEGPEKIGFEEGAYRVKQPVLGAFRNNETQWSIRYTTEPDCGLEGFIRMTYKSTGGRWKATSGLFEGASDQPDPSKTVQPSPSKTKVKIRLPSAAGQAGGELSQEAAVAAAVEWYDVEGPEKIGFEEGAYRVKQPVLGAFRNNETQWSIRYTTEPDCGLEGFIRMTYKSTGGRWKATSGLFEGASDQPDPSKTKVKIRLPSFKSKSTGLSKASPNSRATIVSKVQSVADSGSEGEGKAAGDLSREAAVAAAVEWYSTAAPSEFDFPKDTYQMQVLDAFRNRDTEWSIRYRTEPPVMAGEAIQIFFFRFRFKRVGRARWLVKRATEDGASTSPDREKGASISSSGAQKQGLAKEAARDESDEDLDEDGFLIDRSDDDDDGGTLQDQSDDGDWDHSSKPKPNPKPKTQKKLKQPPQKKRHKKPMPEDSLRIKVDPLAVKEAEAKAANEEMRAEQQRVAKIRKVRPQRIAFPDTMIGVGKCTDKSTVAIGLLWWHRHDRWRRVGARKRRRGRRFCRRRMIRCLSVARCGGPSRTHQQHGGWL